MPMLTNHLRYERTVPEYPSQDRVSVGYMEPGLVYRSNENNDARYVKLHEFDSPTIIELFGGGGLHMARLICVKDTKAKFMLTAERIDLQFGRKQTE